MIFGCRSHRVGWRSGSRGVELGPVRVLEEWLVVLMCRRFRSGEGWKRYGLLPRLSI